AFVLPHPSGAKMKSLVCGLLFGLLIQVATADDWTRFRGPNGSGVAPSAEAPPANWSDSENLKWKVPLPGKGASSPIVVGNKVLVTSYSGYGLDKENPGEPASLKRHLSCYDRATGKQLWDQVVSSPGDEDEYKGFITEHGYASSTPVTDGERVYAMFGKSGLYCYDLAGKQVWQKQLGTNSDPSKWGNGASPVLFGDLVIINAGIEGQAIVALNKTSGEEVWKVADPKFTSCWSTPILVEINGRQEFVFSMPGQIVALHPATGAQLWNAKSPIEQTVCASLAECNGVVFAMRGLGGVAVAYRCGGEGDVTETHKVWQKPLRAGIDTPLVVGKQLYWLSVGSAFCANCESGEVVYKEQLSPAAANAPGQRRSPTSDSASPVAAGELVYMVQRSGKVHVLKAGEKFERLATNEFTGDAGPFNASPAISSGELFIRSDNALYCIGK
ncbi:MAG: PQQ-binding-like beta-propeller repeat protein, partial [Planctomycetota bacterium]